MKRKLSALLSNLVLILSLTACSLGVNTTTLTKWYNSKDRINIEQQINDLNKAQGLKFFITVEEPDIIVYNFQYMSLSFDSYERESMASLVESYVKATAPSCRSSIKQYRDTYHLPVNTIRMAYLDSDGNTLYSIDLDENYEPSVNLFTGRYNSLEDWLGSEDKESFVSVLNSSMEQIGLAIDFDTDGEMLILICRFTEQLDFSGFDPEEINAYFAEDLPSYLDKEMLLESLNQGYGINIDNMRIQFKNADGALLCDFLLSELPTD